MNNKFFLLIVMLFGTIIADCTEELKKQITQEQQTSFFSKCVEGGITFFTSIPSKITNHYVNHGAGQQAIKQLALNDKLLEILSKDNEVLLNALTRLSKDAGAEIAAQAALASTIKEGVEKLKEKSYLEYGQNVAVIGIGIYTTIEGCYKFSRWTKSWFPSEEEINKQKLDADDTAKKLAFGRAERALNACLVDNQEGAKDKDGMPCNCSEELKNFAKAAGLSELRKIKKLFNNQ